MREPQCKLVLHKKAGKIYTNTDFIEKKEKRMDYHIWREKRKNQERSSKIEEKSRTA